MTAPTSGNDREPPPHGPDAAAERPAVPPEPTRVREAFTYGAEAPPAAVMLEREERDPLSFQRQRQAGLDPAARAAARARFG